MDVSLNDVTVTHNEETHRFEAGIGGLRASITYSRFPGRIAYTHTEVPQPLEGQGMAAKLACVALDFARVNDLRVARSVPTSPVSFVSTLGIRISFLPTTSKNCSLVDSTSHVPIARGSEILSCQIRYSPSPPL